MKICALEFVLVKDGVFLHRRKVDDERLEIKIEPRGSRSYRCTWKAERGDGRKIVITTRGVSKERALKEIIEVLSMASLAKWWVASAR